MLEETLSLFVEAIGKDEASMRQQLESKRSEELQRNREFWENTRRGETTLPDEEKGSVGVLQEAAKLQTKEARGFRKEFEQKVMTGYSSGSVEGQERYLG